MTDKTQPTAHAEITAPISADLRRIDDAGAKSAPITLMTEDRACAWAWDQVQQDVGTKGWTAGDSCNFYGFFLWGWNYRGQYETQRPAAPPAPAAVAVPADWRELLEFWIAPQLERARKEAFNRGDGPSANGYLDALDKARAALAAAPAQEHATQLAGIPKLATPEMRAAFRAAYKEGGFWSDRLDYALDKMLAAAPAQAQEDARVQWWLATIDQHGNPTLTDGAHSDRAGADKAAYLIDALGVGWGKKYAVARVELSEPKPNADGVNHEAVAQCNRAARAAQGGA